MDSETEVIFLPEKPTIDDRLAALEAAEKGVIVRDHQGQILGSREFWIYIALDLPALHGPIGLVGLVLDLLAAGRAEEARPLSWRLVSVVRNAYRDFLQFDRGSGRHTGHMEPIVDGLIAGLWATARLNTLEGKTQEAGEALEDASRVILQHAGMLEAEDSYRYEGLHSFLLWQYEDHSRPNNADILVQSGKGLEAVNLITRIADQMGNVLATTGVQPYDRREAQEILDEAGAWLAARSTA